MIVSKKQMFLFAFYWRQKKKWWFYKIRFDISCEVYVCIYVCMYVCMYVRTYVRMYLSIDRSTVRPTDQCSLWHCGEEPNKNFTKSGESLKVIYTYSKQRNSKSITLIGHVTTSIWTPVWTLQKPQKGNHHSSKGRLPQPPLYFNLYWTVIGPTGWL